jgi:hypothetical protein
MTTVAKILQKCERLTVLEYCRIRWWRKRSFICDVDVFRSYMFLDYSSPFQYIVGFQLQPKVYPNQYLHRYPHHLTNTYRAGRRLNVIYSKAEKGKKARYGMARDETYVTVPE